MPASAFFTAATFANLLPMLSPVAAAVGAVTRGSPAPVGAGMATSREMAATATLEAAATTTTLAAAPLHLPGGALGANSAKRQAMRFWTTGIGMMKTLSPMHVLLLQL